MHDFCSPVCAGHPYVMDAPESEMVFIFQKVKPTWNQRDLSSVYTAACLLHLWNTSFARSAEWQWRDLVGLIIRPVWLKTLTGCGAAWRREELQSKRSQSCKRIIIKQMQSSSTDCCLTGSLLLQINWLIDWQLNWKWKKLKNLLKCPLVNETLWPETETRPRRLAFSPRRDRGRDLPTLCRDRDETKTFEKYVSRRSRDRDVETETTTLPTDIQEQNMTILRSTDYRGAL